MRRSLFSAVGAAVCCAAVLISIFCLPSRSAFAAEETPQRAAADYVLYDNSNGLPTSEANAIVQSKDGFIWIGGYSGLIRYDGIDFERFDSSYGITTVVSLYIDSKERLWIGTSDSGAAVYENGEFRFYGRSEGLESLFVHAITEDANGNIIFATTEGLFISLTTELSTGSTIRAPTASTSARRSATMTARSTERRSAAAFLRWTISR